MTDARLPDLKEDWLAGNAAVAFVGVLLVAQSYVLSDGTYEFLFNVTVPAFHEYVYMGLAIFLLIWSVVLAVASAVPSLRCWAVRQIRPFAPLMAFVVWVAYILSWLEAISIVPTDEWWRPVLVFVGLAFLLFLGYRTLKTTLQSVAAGCQVQ